MEGLPFDASHGMELRGTLRSTPARWLDGARQLAASRGSPGAHRVALRRAWSEDRGKMTIPVNVGYVALFVIVFVAEAGVPLLAPTELVLVAGGVAAANGDASLSVIAALALTADLLGTSALSA